MIIKIIGCPKLKGSILHTPHPFATKKKFRSTCMC